MAKDGSPDFAPATERVPGDPLDVEQLDAAPPPHDAYAALRSGNYLRFASGFLFSSLGLQMQSMAVAWEVYERTGNPLDLGLIGLVRAGPVIGLAMVAGHVADSFDRRNVLLVTQSAFALCGLALAVASANAAPVWTLLLILGLMACARAFNGTSRGALLPSIVPPGVFQNAVTWNTVVFHVSAAVGPLLAGGMIVWCGRRAWPVYAAMAVGCGMFALLTRGIHPLEPQRPTGRFTLESMLAGVRHVRRERVILAAMTLDLLAVLLGGATGLMPVFARDILHVGPVGLGLLNAAPFAGAVVMALFLAHRPPFRRAGRALLWSVAAFGAATIVFGFSRSLWLSLVTLFILGAVDNISVVIRHVVVQARTPDDLRGRVSAVNSVFIESSNELGRFESGAVAQAFGGGVFGAIVSVVSGGIGTMLTVGAVAVGWPELRRMGRAEGDGPKAGSTRPSEK